MTLTLQIDPIACTGHGLCADLVPELIELDEWGYPILADTVPPDLEAHARRAVNACPALALRLVQTREGLAARQQHFGGIGGGEMGYPTATHSQPRHSRQDRPDGVEGNERLTAMTGALLLIGFAVEGFTVLSIHKLLFIHELVGGLLIGPVLLKMASTMYRFARYYTGSPPYVRKGPPSPVLRLLGPFVVLTSVAVLGTGIIAGIVGPGNGQWLFLHKATFVLWFGVMTIHVLNYAPRLPRILWERPAYGGTAGAAGGPVRWLALAISLAAGIAIAALALQLSTKWGAGGL